MRVIYVVGCFLTLAVVVTPSEGGFLSWGKKEGDGEKKDIEVGLVNVKKLSSSPQVNSAQSAPKTQSTNDPKNTAPSGQPPKPSQKPNGPGPRTETTVSTAPVRPKIQRPSPPGKPIQPPGKPIQPTGKPIQPPGKPIQPAGKPNQPAKPVDQKVMQDPKARAVVTAGTAVAAAAQKQINVNQKKADQLEKKVDELKKDLVTRNRDQSLEDIIEDLLDVTKKRFKIKFALVIYAIINFILFVAGHAGSFITPPVGKTIYFLDLITKNVLRKPLDDWFAEYQKENAEIVAKYINRHPEQFKNIKKGKRVTIETPQGKFSFKVLKTRVGEPLLDTDLHIVDRGPIQVFRTVYQLKR